MADHDHSHEGLNVEVERTDAGTAKVSFSVSAEEFDRTVMMGLQNMASRTKLKGFRPGKVPAAMLEKQYGAQVRQDAVQHFLNHAYDHAVKDHDLKPAAHPRVDLEGVTVEKGEPFSFDFEVFLRPDYELGEYKGLEVERNPIAVDDEEVEGALEDVRRQQSRPEPAGEDGLPADGMAVCTLAFRMEGRDEPLLERSGIRLSPKTAPGGIDPAVFEEKLTGARQTAVIEVPVTFPEEFPEEEARGKEGVCVVTVDEAFAIVPPTDEEMFALFEAEDREGMRDSAREKIKEAKTNQEEARIESALLDQVIEMHPMQIPDAYLEQQVQAKATETRKGLLEQGLGEEEADAQVDAQLGQMRADTEKALRAVYLMEDIAKAEDLKVTQEEMTAELESIAERNAVPVEEVGKYYQEQGLFSQLALELLERKIRSFLKDSADIRDGTG